MSNKKQKKYYTKRAKAAKSGSSGEAGAAARALKSRPIGDFEGLFDLKSWQYMIARIFLLAMAFVFPLLIGPEKYANVTYFKNMTFYIIAVIAFTLIIVKLISDITKIPDDQFDITRILSSFKLNAVDVAVLLYWGFLLISALLSDYKYASFFGQGVRNDGFIIQTFYVATYFAISKLLKLRKFDLNVYCFGATAVAILVIMHYFGLDVLNTGYSEPNWISGMLFLGPMGNVNLTSYFVTVTAVISASIYVTGQSLDFRVKGKPWTKYLGDIVTLACYAVLLFAELNLNTDAGIVALGVALLVSLPMLMISFSRIGRMAAVMSVTCGVMLLERLIIDMLVLGGSFGKVGWAELVGLIVFTAVACLINFKVIRLSISRLALLIASLALDAAAIVGALAVAFVAANTQSSGILYELGQMLYYHNFDDTFGSKRIFTWKRTIKLAKNHLIFGSGPDTFCDVFKAAYGDEVEEFFSGKNLDKAHNEYLQLLICSGVTGLGSFLAFIGGMVAKAFKRATDNPLLVCCAMGVIAYSIHAFFGYSLPINSPLMWVLFGLTGAAIQLPPLPPLPPQEKETAQSQGK